MTTTTKMTGESLVQYADEQKPLIERGEKTRTQVILDAGYAYDNGKAMYTEYYTELLRAQGTLPVTSRDVADDSYDALSTDEQELYDAIDEKLGEKWEHEEIMEFIDELDDIGITTADALDEAYEWETDSYYNAGKEFAEYFVIEVMDANIPDIVLAAVDWSDVWEHNLRYDYNVIETNNGAYFFRNI